LQVTKGVVKALVGNHAVAYAVKQAKPQVLAVYPITPQTTMLEKLSEYVDRGELKARMIRVESEHSALASIYGAAVARGQSVHGDGLTGAPIHDRDAILGRRSEGSYSRRSGH
jgi:Pyruvate:ferredoxin oxidoreductase and related 2-oxoacid:ferredoxin oxidoreductases, alpha subunit